MERTTHLTWSCGVLLGICLALFGNPSKAKGLEGPALRMLPVQIAARISTAPNEREFRVSDEIQYHCLNQEEFPSSKVLTTALSSVINEKGLSYGRSDSPLLLVTIVEASCGVNVESRGYSAPLFIYYQNHRESEVSVVLNVELIAPKSGLIQRSFRVQGRGLSQMSSHWAWFLWHSESRALAKWEDVIRHAMEKAVETLAQGEI